MANDAAVALMRSPLPDNQVLDNLQYYASLFLSEKTTLHGVFLEVLGMGVLLTGDPAVGKSELALDLITRGSRLVADDAPEFTRIAPTSSVAPARRCYVNFWRCGDSASSIFARCSATARSSAPSTCA